MSKNLVKVYIDPNESFNSSPNLICKEDIIKDNYDDYYISDSFEVYYSYQNFNEIMIVSPNKNQKNNKSIKRSFCAYLYRSSLF